MASAGKMVSPHSSLNTIVSIILQSRIMICLVSRISVSALWSPIYSYFSFYKRLDKLPGSTIALWLAIAGNWIYAVSVDILQHGTNLSHRVP